MKEINAELYVLRKTSAANRKEIADLERSIAQLKHMALPVRAVDATERQDGIEGIANGNTERQAVLLGDVVDTAPGR